MLRALALSFCMIAAPNLFAQSGESYDKQTEAKESVVRRAMEVPARPAEPPPPADHGNDERTKAKESVVRGAIEAPARPTEPSLPADHGRKWNPRPSDPTPHAADPDPTPFANPPSIPHPDPTPAPTDNKPVFPGYLLLAALLAIVGASLAWAAQRAYRRKTTSRAPAVPRLIDIRLQRVGIGTSDGAPLAAAGPAVTLALRLEHLSGPRSNVPIRRKANS